jgi:hypothetical protein
MGGSKHQKKTDSNDVSAINGIDEFLITDIITGKTMKIKVEYIILIAIIIALGAYLSTRKTGQSNYEMPDLVKIEKKEISKISVKSGKDSYTLLIDGDKWKIGDRNLPADSKAVTSMLDTISELKLSALVSEKKSYDRYELADDQKISVSAWAGKESVRQFDIGKPASSYRHTYIKLNDKPEIYLAEKNFQDKFPKASEKLIDKSVFTKEPGNYSAVTGLNGDTKIA